LLLASLCYPICAILNHFIQKRTMRKIIWIIVFAFAGCSNPLEKHAETAGTQSVVHTVTEERTLEEARRIIDSAYYCTLVTINGAGQPKARIMEPFPPGEDFSIWLATNPKSRKVTEVSANSKVTLHYFDKNRLAYTSLYGKAHLVDDPEIKSRIWREGWEKFYPNRDEDYLLIHFIPDSLELISIAGGYTGDKSTWAPSIVRFDSRSR